MANTKRVKHARVALQTLPLEELIQLVNRWKIEIEALDCEVRDIWVDMCADSWETAHGGEQEFCVIECRYLRDMTPEELEEEERQMEIKRAQWEARDRILFERLKKKYGW